MRKNQIKFSELRETQLVSILNMDDYFGDNKPYIEEEVTKKEFIDNYLTLLEEGKERTGNEEVISLNDYLSCDGDDSRTLLTSIDNVIWTILPDEEED